MKFSATLLTSLLATAASAQFDKNQPWGKRDYACINVYQGIPDHSAVTAGTSIEIRFDRDSQGRCGAYLDAYTGEPYSVWLYNNPVRNLDVVSWDHSVKLADGIQESAGAVTITIPTDLPAVSEGGLWYLKLSTTLKEAPQMPSLFNAAGPFTIKA